MTGIVRIAEREDGGRLAGPLFRRRFGGDPPDFPHHVVAAVRGADGCEVPLCYIHFTAMDGCLLGGGACVDNRALRLVGELTRAHLRACGGLYRVTLEWAIGHFSRQYEAIFGYCGDVLAERIDRQCGFVSTGHRHLLVRWLGEVDAVRREQLIASAHAVGPF